MVTLAQEYQKNDIIHIWNECFPGDSPEFIDLYFTKKYKSENTLVYLLEDKIASCLQILPYEMKYCGDVCPMFYISGAATLPEYRNRGLMKELLLHAFQEMKNRGALFTTLIPQEEWLAGYYQKYGYTPCFDYITLWITRKISVFDDLMFVTTLKTHELKEAYDYYQKQSEKHAIFVQKSFDDFTILCEELKQRRGGEIYLCRRDDKICGLCFCYASVQRLQIFEMQGNNKNMKKIFLRKIIERYPQRKIYLMKCSSNKDLVPPTPKGMARILDAEKVLNLFALHHDEMKLTIKVNDEQIVENNAVFCLENGTCTRKENGNFDMEVNINLLTQLLLGYQIQNLPQEYGIFPQNYPHMSLMLE
ncbi:MAG: GNAT family N-acetyltransferase [Tannerellaceae bacterium]|jgi:predicted acetyltransferase|nr:GNAT family N-acetyltransferase [Tannerellaceae bacterium]